MSEQSLPYQLGFYAYVSLTVLLWVATFAAGWWLARTIKKYRR